MLSNNHGYEHYTFTDTTKQYKGNEDERSQEEERVKESQEWDKETHSKAASYRHAKKKDEENSQ